MRILYALLLVISLLPNLASAACPGSNGVSASFAFVSGTSGIGSAFIGPGCTGMAVGSPAPINCTAAALGTIHLFSATWVSPAARTAAGTGGGCVFNCAGVGTMGTASPSCYVDGATGLPVELMEFSVGE